MTEQPLALVWDLSRGLHYTGSAKILMAPPFVYMPTASMQSNYGYLHVGSHFFTIQQPVATPILHMAPAPLINLNLAASPQTPAPIGTLGFTPYPNIASAAVHVRQYVAPDPTAPRTGPTQCCQRNAPRYHQHYRYHPWIPPLPGYPEYTALPLPAHPPAQPPTRPAYRPTNQPTARTANQSTAQPAAQPAAQPINPPVTQHPTQAPTVSPTQAPTQDPTQAPTQDPTQAPTQVPTPAPTPAPTQPDHPPRPDHPRDLHPEAVHPAPQHPTTPTALPKVHSFYGEKTISTLPERTEDGTPVMVTRTRENMAMRYMDGDALAQEDVDDVERPVQQQPRQQPHPQQGQQPQPQHPQSQHHHYHQHQQHQQQHQHQHTLHHQHQRQRQHQHQRQQPQKPTNANT